MAEKKIVLDIEINTDKANNSVKDTIDSMGRLRRELAQLNAQAEDTDKGTEAFKKLQKEIKKTENDIKKAEAAFGDATDKIRTLSGSGVERATASFGLLKEGITNLDFGKFKTGVEGVGGSFKALGGAIKATGIGLLITGITYLIANFDELKKSGGLLGTVLNFIGDKIKLLTDGLEYLADKFHIIDLEQQKQDEKRSIRAKKLIDDEKEKRDAIDDRYTKEIALAKALGKETEALELQALETNKVRLESDIKRIESFQKSFSLLDSVLGPYLKQIKKEYKDTQDAIEIKEAESTKKRLDKEKERIQKVEELNDKYTLNQLQRIDKEKEAKLKEAKELGASAEVLAGIENEYWQKTLEERKRLSGEADSEIKSKTVTSVGETIQEVGLTIQETPVPPIEIKVLTPTEQIQVFFEEYKKQIEASFQIGEQFVNALSSLNDLVTTNKLKNLEKGSKAEEVVLRKSFERNKKLAIAGAVISGFQGVVNALTAKSTIPEPFGTALKIATSISVAAATAANIAKIAATKFDSTSSATGGGSTGGGGVDVPTSPIGIAQGVEAVRPSNFSLFGTGGTSNNLGSGQNVVQAVVLESDITATQKRVGKFKQASEL